LIRLIITITRYYTKLEISISDHHLRIPWTGTLLANLTIIFWLNIWNHGLKRRKSWHLQESHANLIVSNLVKILLHEP